MNKQVFIFNENIIIRVSWKKLDSCTELFKSERAHIYSSLSEGVIYTPQHTLTQQHAYTIFYHN